MKPLLEKCTECDGTKTVTIKGSYNFGKPCTLCQQTGAFPTKDGWELIRLLRWAQKTGQLDF